MRVHKNYFEANVDLSNVHVRSQFALLAPQAQEILNNIVRSLSAKIQGSYSVVLHSLRLRLQFALIRAISYVLGAPSPDFRKIGQFPVFINYALAIETSTM